MKESNVAMQMPPDPKQFRLGAQAADLILRLDEDPTLRTRMACVRFLKRSSEHMRVFLEMDFLMHATRRLRDFGLGKLEVAYTADNIVYLRERVRS